MRKLIGIEALSNDENGMVTMPMYRNMKIYLTGCLIILFIVGCFGDIKTQVIQANNDCKAIKLNFEHKEILVGDIFESIEIIPLETNDNCLLALIKHLDIDDSTLFIQNSYDKDKLVYAFDLAGKFKYRIGTIGQGPEELRFPKHFVLNKNDREIWISDNYQEIFKYDYQGHFKEKTPLKLVYDDMRISDNGFLYLYASKSTNFNKTGGYDCWELWIKHINSDDYKVYFQYNYETYPNGERYRTNLAPFSNVNNTTTFHYIYSDTVYSIVDDIVKSKYNIDFGAKKIKQNMYLLSTDQQDEYIKKHTTEAGLVGHVMETANILTFSYFINMKRYTVFYYKNSGKIIEGTFEGAFNNSVFGARITFMLAKDKSDELIGYFNPAEIDFDKQNTWNLDEAVINKLKSLPDDSNVVLVKCKFKNLKSSL